MKLFLIPLLLATNFLSVNAWAQVQSVPPLKKVVWVWLENTSYSQMIQQRYVRTLFQNYPSVRFSSYLPTSPVTQANALSMIAGNDFGITDNELTRVSSQTLINLLESKNIPWRVYAEDYPGSCYLSAGVGHYKRYRVPFLSIDRVQTDRYLCMKVVGFRSLDEDIKFGSLPDFTVVIPSLKGSGAMSDVGTADATLKRVLEPIVTNPDLLQETTIIISTMNHAVTTRPEMFTMIVGNGLVPNRAVTNSNPYNHYNLLRTIEDGLGLGNLNQNDAQAEPMQGFWRSP